MAHAFVMITTAAGEAAAVRDAVAALDAVQEAHVVAGTYDVVAEVSDDDVADTLNVVTSEVRRIDGVEGTRTYVSLD